MRVELRQQLVLPVDPAAAGALLDTLGSGDDRLWPTHRWPALELDSGLRPGSTGGHGPFRYTVVAYQPAQRVTFEFTGRFPHGLAARFGFETTPGPAGHSLLRHALTGRAYGLTRLGWLSLYQPLHAALAADCLHRAAQACGATPTRPAPWGPRVLAARAAVLGSRY